MAEIGLGDGAETHRQTIPLTDTNRNSTRAISPGT